MKERLRQQSRGTETDANSDEQLLLRYAVSRDELAFRRLVQRHGALVLGVCRRILRNEHDAEEAFQATFMVLAKKAGDLRSPSALSAWLYGVAFRVARRAAHKRTARRETPLPLEIVSDDDVFRHVADVHRQRALDEELNQLAPRYREPLVLHYLLGKTNQEIAQLLGLSVRSVEGRQRRGKKILRRRLALRKVSLPLAAVALAGACHSAQAAGVSAPLAEATIAAGLNYAWGAAAPANICHLAQQEILTMSLPITTTSTACFAVLLFGATFGMAGDSPAGAPSRSAAELAADSDTITLVAQQDAGAAEAADELFGSPPEGGEFDAGEAPRGSAGQPSAGMSGQRGGPGMRGGMMGRGMMGGAPGGMEGEAVYGGEMRGRPGMGMRGGIMGRGMMGMEGEASMGMMGSRVTRGRRPNIAEQNAELGVFDLKKREPWEIRILEALDSETPPIDFVEMPLRDVLDYINESKEIEIMLDLPALREEGIAPDFPVTMNLSRIKLRSALRLLLRGPQLTYIIQDEVMLITTPEKAATTVETRVYNVSEFNVSAQELAKVLPTTIEPKSWDTAGGPGHVQTVDNGRGLMITQSLITHRKINELLAQLQRYQESQKKPAGKQTQNPSRPSGAGGPAGNF